MIPEKEHADTTEKDLYNIDPKEFVILDRKQAGKRGIVKPWRA